jgi:polyisoprenoid-binding protein YceI
VLELKRILLALVFACLVASCARPVRAPGPIPSIPPEPAADTRGAQVYTVSSDASRLHILVYRGGKLARLGHNHVVTSRSISGRAWLHPEFERSGFELTVPVQSLIVDDPEDRRAHGADFPLGISQKDIEGTKRNMLRPEVLDGERYPTISIKCAEVKGTRDSPTVTARITIKEGTRDISVPVQIAIDGARLTATGEFDILQTDFGMKPFSVVLGALEVQDRLHLEFSIVAEKDS